MTFRPKYMTFGCHGTLINLNIVGAAHVIVGIRADRAGVAVADLVDRECGY
ncbi:hypothetical protein [Natronohydrobacter thiooxidans]|uniref:hypothetical protein n=1 Tax=Natronohydrobacter thiooxidans TaxID=87172 RepID=UPI000AA28B94|nr:hypothetical protein [Natronohydrobacter thiooxidans]